MKRVALYIDTMGKGGAQRVMLIIATHLLKCGYEVCLINDYPLNRDDVQYTIDERIQVKYIDKKNRYNSVKKNWIRLKGLRKIIKKEKPLLVLSFLGRPNMRMLIATIGLKTKKIVSVRNDPYYEYGHGFKKVIARILFLLADGCVFQTNEAKSYFFHHTQNKSVVIPNPVEDIFIESECIRDNNSKIITVGRLEKQKNHELLIDAFAELLKTHPDEILAIYGNGSLKDKLQSHIRKLGISNKVVLAGNIDNIVEVYRKCKLFVLSSDFEGMPNALMEAMCVGVPCISTDCPCGGPKELIQNNYNGVLVPIRDRDKMMAAMQMLVNDPDLSELMGKNAKIGGQKLSEDKIIKEWFGFLSI